LVVFWLVWFPADVAGSMDWGQQSQQRPGEGIKHGANDNVSLTRDRAFIRSKGGSVEEKSPPRGRRLTGVEYQERTSGNCGNSGGGWGKITSAAACEAGAAALSWSDTTAWTVSTSDGPPGCSYSASGDLIFNTDNPNYACSSNLKCLCTLVQGCPPGTYRDQTGQSTCKSCPSDTYSIAGASSCPFDATSCPTGTYASGTATVCDSCGTGKYNDATKQTSESVACKSCVAGEYQNEVGKASCTSCPTGTYASGAATVCDPCGTGKYNDQTSQTSESSCKDNCNAGSYINSDKSACLNCIEGQYQDQNDQSSCKQCVNGKYSDQINQRSNSTCKECETAKFNDETGASSCKMCESGTYNDQTGQAICKTDCSFGSVIPPNKTMCYNCPAGQFQDVNFQSTCKVCISGQYNDQIGQSFCRDDCGNGLSIRSDKTACDLAPVCTNTQGSSINLQGEDQNNFAACKCGTATCSESTGLYCTELVSMCTKGESQCGTTSLSFKVEQCLVVTDRCKCTQCISGYHTTNCSPCTLPFFCQNLCLLYYLLVHLRVRY
jgi:hypothetical protein